MFEDKPVIELVNKPIPVPFEVLLLLIVGILVVLLQQTPRSDTVLPPSLLILPPLLALDVVIEVAEVVVIVGSEIVFVLKLCVLPYTVPILFVA